MFFPLLKVFCTLHERKLRTMVINMKTNTSCKLVLGLPMTRLNLCKLCINWLPLLNTCTPILCFKNLQCYTVHITEKDSPMIFLTSSFSHHSNGFFTKIENILTHWSKAQVYCRTQVRMMNKLKVEKSFLTVPLIAPWISSHHLKTWAIELLSWYSVQFFAGIQGVLYTVY